MSTELEVRKASEQFYAALNKMANGDASQLTDVWSHSANVVTMHPIGGRQVGWESVKESFSQVAHVASQGQITLRDQMIQVIGDMAYEVGIEQGQFKMLGEQVAIEHRVTNIYRREAAGWKLVHHHTDISPAMVALLSKAKV